MLEALQRAFAGKPIQPTAQALNSHLTSLVGGGVRKRVAGQRGSPSWQEGDVRILERTNIEHSG